MAGGEHPRRNDLWIGSEQGMGVALGGVALAPGWRVAEQLDDDLADQERRVRGVIARDRLLPSIRQAVASQGLRDVWPPEVGVADARATLLLRRECRRHRHLAAPGLSA